MYTDKIDLLKIEVYDDRQRMGEAAGRAVALRLRKLLREQDSVRIVFAAAPSQNEMLAELSTAPSIEWERVTVFHMDEYIGLPQEADQHFSRFLNNRFQPGNVHLIRSNVEPEEEINRYVALIKEARIDIICLGIGENGHLAFNDPPVADFNDPSMMKTVELDQECRQQQVNDGCFASLHEVPTQALTLTIPAIMSGRHLYCTVPGSTKSKALQLVRSSVIDQACPATILRRHPSCMLFTDREAYELL